MKKKQLLIVSLKDNKSRLFLSVVIFIELLLITILLLALQRSYNSIKGFTKFANYYGIIIGNITSLIPFSLFEFGIIVLIIITIITFVKFFILLKKRNKVVAFTKLLSIFSLAIFIMCLYISTATFAYNKKTVFLGFENRNDYSFEVVEKSVAYHFSEFNRLAETLNREKDGSIKFPYSQKELAKRVREEYKKAEIDFLYDFVPRPKPIANSWFMTNTFILGISFMPTVEPNYNINTPPADLPHTIAHEIAHSLGVMTEYDANYLATYILLNSDDEYLRYSAYFNSINLFATDLEGNFNSENERFIDKILPLIKLNDKIRKESKLYSDFWANNYGFMAKVGNFFNNLYLKLSGVNDGTGSYIEPPTIPDDEEDLKDLPFNRYQKMYFEHLLQS